MPCSQMGDLCSRQERQLRLHYQWFSAQSGMRVCTPMSTRGIWQSALFLPDSSPAFPCSGCSGIAEDERQLLAFYEKFRADELVCPNKTPVDGSVTHLDVSLLTSFLSAQVLETDVPVGNASDNASSLPNGIPSLHGPHTALPQRLHSVIDGEPPTSRGDSGTGILLPPQGAPLVDRTNIGAWTNTPGAACSYPSWMPPELCQNQNSNSQASQDRPFAGLFDSLRSVPGT